VLNWKDFTSVGRFATGSALLVGCRIVNLGARSPGGTGVIRHAEAYFTALCYIIAKSIVIISINIDENIVRRNNIFSDRPNKTEAIDSPNMRVQ